MDKRLKLTLPAGEIESAAWDQIKAIMQLDCLKTLAIMPDVHAGYEMPIGGVALLDGHIWPGAVGYDIGCGMCHINTGCAVEDLSALYEIYRNIKSRIPVGFSAHESPAAEVLFKSACGDKRLDQFVASKAGVQLGTLGGGNHFIELGVNTHGEVGITIHSGSRGAGHAIGERYMLARHGPVPLDSELGQQYLSDMNWAVEYALRNRRQMMFECLSAAGFTLHQSLSLAERMINENHNHAVVTPDGVLHRKGATPAETGQLGIIPANMRDGVWITVGLGNEEYLKSASHGAGRRMSRGQAKKTVDAQALEAEMAEIYCPPVETMLDEAPSAYKNINEVLIRQDGLLVDVIENFKTILVVKG